MTKEQIIISADEAGKRIDVVLATRFSDFSRSYFQHLIANHLILINGKKTKAGYRVGVGEIVQIFFQEIPGALPPAGENIPLDVIFEDHDVLVINKPAGLVVHPAAGNLGGTLVNALLQYYPDITKTVDKTGLNRPGLVHRLDKDTSGVMIVAKNRRAFHSLARQIANRQVDKIYTGLCFGEPRDHCGRLVGHLGRHPKNRQKIADIGPEKGREAITDYCLCESYHTKSHHPVSMIKFKIMTGRTHQIRVQSADHKIPILGDDLYGTKESHKLANYFGIKRQMLHAQTISFCLPGETVKKSFTAPWPDDIKIAYNRIKKESILHFTDPCDNL